MRCLAWTSQRSEGAAGQTCKQTHPRLACCSRRNVQGHMNRESCWETLSAQYIRADDTVLWYSTRVSCLDGGAGLRHSRLKQGHIKLCQPVSSLSLLVRLAAIEQVVGHRRSNLAGHLAALCGALQTKHVQLCKAVHFTAIDKKA